MLSRNIKYLIGVDHLRGYAALLVILYHGTQLIGADIAHQSAFTAADYGYTNWNIFKSMISEGHFGVALFMTLSGFIFTTGLYGKRMDVKGFFRNRFIRIYPLYIFLILLTVTLYNSPNPLQSLILNILPFANVGNTQLTTGILATAAMFWTISVEVQFYLVFPFLLRWLNERKFKLLAGIILLFTVMRLIAFLSGDVSMSTFGYFSIFGRMDEFIIGMMAAYVYLKKPSWITTRKHSLLALSVTGIVLLLFVMNRLRHHFGYTAFENFYVILPSIEGLLAAALIVTYVIVFHDKTKSLLSRAMAKIGELSYSLYLTHFLVLTLLVSKTNLPNIFGDWWWSGLFFSIVILIPAALALSALTYYTIERPFLNLRKKYIIDKKPEVAQQAL
jgi:peptidoglycan/LPS O-acetylase OafA/YrhL